MKVQFQGQFLRMRLDEDELSRLLDGQAVVAEISFGAMQRWALCLQLQRTERPAFFVVNGQLQLRLPFAEVAALARRLPSRDGLGWDICCEDAELHLQFDVDVRDSMRQRGLGKHMKHGHPDASVQSV